MGSDCLASDSEKRSVLDLSAKERIIVEHREVGRKIASRMLSQWRAHLGPEELDGIVDLALCEAAERFDPNRGASFATFLFYYVRGALISTIKVSASEQRAKAVLACSLGAMKNESIDLENDPDLSLCLDHDVAASVTSVSPEEIFLQQERVSCMTRVMTKLDRRESEVLCRVFMKGESLKEVAVSLGISVREVKSLRGAALDDLRAGLADLGLDVPAPSSSRKRLNALEFQRTEHPHIRPPITSRRRRLLQARRWAQSPTIIRKSAA